MKKLLTIFVVCFLALSVFCGKVIDLTDPQMRMRFEREWSLFAQDQAQLLLYLQRAHRYFLVINTILLHYGIEPDFRYHEIIESALRAKVGSNAGAKGWWQFRKSTEQSYGLVINDHIDQRYDLIESTDVAARFILDLLERFGDSYLAMASYNWCRINVASAINEQDTADCFQLKMPEETMRYNVRAASIKYAMEHPLLFGINLSRIDLWPPVELVDTVQVTVGYRLPAHYVVDWCNTTRAEIERLNPELIGDKWTPGPNGPATYLIKTPPGTKEYFQAGLDSLTSGSKK